MSQVDSERVVAAAAEVRNFWEVFENFVRFVRANPHLEPDNPAMARAFAAYVTSAHLDREGE